MNNKKGFTLIELLAVIVILGLLMTIGIVSVTQYIEDSRLKSYVSIAKEYISIASTELAKQDKIIARDSNTVYYIHINNLKTEKENKGSPFGEWVDAYVIVTIDPETGNFNYYWSSIDTAGYIINEVSDKDLNKRSVEVNTRTEISTSNAIGGRDNIVIYDKDGNKITNVPPSLEIDSEKQNCFEYEIGENGIIITGYDISCGTDVVIPTKIDGVNVYEIGASAFKNKGVTNVTIYKGIVKIGHSAFYGNKINTVKLSISVKNIDAYGFYNSKIKTLIMSEGIESIGSYAFANNNICSVVFPSSLKKIGDHAFANNCLTKVNLPAGIEVEGATFAGNDVDDAYAFIYKKNLDGTADYSSIVGYAGNNVKNIVIPEEKNGVVLKRIESNAFSSTGLDGHLEIPSTVTYIGGQAFAYNSIDSVSFPEGLKTIGGSAFRQNQIKELELPSTLTSIGNSAFTIIYVQGENAIVYARKNDGSIDYRYIVSYAGGLYSPESVTIPAQVNGVTLERINASAFKSCGLEEIVLPDISQTPKLTIQAGAFAANNIQGSDAFIYSTVNGKIDYSTIIDYAGPSKGDSNYTIDFPEYSPKDPSKTPLKNINVALTWMSYRKVIIPSSVESIANAAFGKYPRSESLKTIVNKTGRSFQWDKITASSYTANNTFVTGTIKHEAGNIEVVDSE